MSSAALPVGADQLGWNDAATSHKAADFLSRQPYVMVYCSRCDEQVIQVWRMESVSVEAVEAVRTVLYEVRFEGILLYEATRPIDRDKSPYGLQYLRVRDGGETETVALDLAYTYVPLAGGWGCLGKAIGAECEVNTEWVGLPEEVMEALYPEGIVVMGEPMAEASKETVAVTGG